ncbi:hypothetical protein HGP14_02760 [Rhizobium sp. P32RR-XVIII]|uniref:hypothetical protein n=1 Tax=Rhizobium sp. P32RR-XVIII TaxID=2726738 RepID=UPI0014577940|nr:hypothetical protein [Rhizobium sp. P32RR-XVIII]NLS02290.1 hypothetical protein [Rhizobium sp. P32RR-XVIII]
MASAADTARLASIRQRHADASRDWQLGRGGTELHAVIVANTSHVQIAELAPDCGYLDRDFLLHAHEDIAFLLRLLKRASEKVRSLSPPEDPRVIERRHAKRQRQEMELHTDWARDCGIKCNDRLFRRFLVERYQLPDVADAERIAVSVRNILRVQSRGELNTDPAARRRWIDFRSDFEAWKTHT